MNMFSLTLRIASRAYDQIRSGQIVLQANENVRFSWNAREMSSFARSGRGRRSDQL